MNKQALLNWIQSLPEDVEALPFELSETVQDSSAWEPRPDLVGSVFNAVYERPVRTQLTLRLQFTGQVRGEFQRDYFGNPRWANIRNVSRKESA